MIIGLVLHSAPGYSETFFRNKIRFLTEAGIKVIVFADKNNKQVIDCDLVEGFSWDGKLNHKIKRTIISIIRLVLSLQKSLKLWRANKKCGFSTKKNLLSLLSSAHILRFDLDWLHFGFATTALGRENLAKIIDARMAFSVRGYDVAIYPVKHPGCYHLLWKNADKMHYISDDLYFKALNLGFSTETQSQKITPAIDTSFFQGERVHSLGTSIKMVTVARLHWKKGLEYTLIALGLLQKEGIDFDYTIIGEGNEYERLIFAAHQLGIKEKVHFVGKKSQQEIKNYFEESNIYLQYSIQEGFCNAVLEAQAVGLLCIVSDAEGLAENVADEFTGWVVPRRNPKALAVQIVNVLKLHESDQIKVSNAAVKRVNEKFNLLKQRSEFLEFYK